MINKISANMAQKNPYNNAKNSKAPAFKGDLIVTANNLKKVGSEQFDQFINNIHYFHLARNIGTIADLVKVAEPNKLTAKFSFENKFNNAVKESVKELNSALKGLKLENDIEIKYSDGPTLI